jgi:diguanylate cyclase (GGDEF)-like protein/PAS domain S-box-containing protein
MGGTSTGFDALTGKLIDLAPYAVFLVDGTGTITWAGAALEELTGYQPNDVIGSNMLDHIDASWNPLALDAALYAISATGPQRPMLYRVRRSDGSSFVAEITANAQIGGDLNAVVAFLRRADERFLFDRVIESLAAGDPLPATLDLLVQVMGAENLEADGMVLMRPSSGDGRFLWAVASESLPSRLASDVGVKGAPWTQAAADGEPRWVPVSDLPSSLAEVARSHGYRWCWCWPVTVEAEIGACLVLWRKADEEPDYTCRMVLENMMRVTGLVIERDHAARRLRHNADHDSLTGLANRTRCFAVLNEALSPEVDDANERGRSAGGPPGAEGVVAVEGEGVDGERGAAEVAELEKVVGVLYVDLDDFKPVNDRFGHAAGDEVLRTVGQRLERAVRQHDLVARIGGDEFVVVCGDVFEAAALVPLAERIGSALRHPIEVPVLDGEHSAAVQVGASIGMAAALRGTCSADELLAAADAALYEAKASGRGGWRAARPSERRRRGS